MKPFFNVKPLSAVLALKDRFLPVQTRQVAVADATQRVLAQDLSAPEDLPGFRRATMDGYAVNAAATFGASESNPAWLQIKGAIDMGQVPDFTLRPQEAAQISTGGMLPKGADSVVMVEHTDPVDEHSVEIYKSVAPLQNVIDASEDFARHETVLPAGTFIRPQEQGLAAGLGFSHLTVFKKPKIGIISTGDEIIALDARLSPGKIRDINTYTLSGLVKTTHADPVPFGIVNDNPEKLEKTLRKSLEKTDMVMISGGSSVGTKDHTLEIISRMPNAEILVHGMSVSPGKPTILATCAGKPVWGLPGQVTSAMVVFKIAVAPMIDHLSGLGRPRSPFHIQGRLTRNIASAQGRQDFIRVKLEISGREYLVTPILGKSGLIRTMIHADGLLEIPEALEGVEKDTVVDVILF